MGPVLHPLTGVEGVAFLGCQPLTTMTMTAVAGDYGIFTDNTIATCNVDAIGQVCYVALSPNNLNGRIAAVSNLYSQFVFRDIIVEYVSNCATSQADSACLAYVKDAGQIFSGGVTQTFSNLRQCQPSITFPFRTDRAFFHFHYSGNELFYAENLSATAPDYRLTMQGAIVGLADKAAGNVAALGYCNIWYIVELYDPIYSQGITLTKKEKELVLALRGLEAQRKEEEKVKEKCVNSDEKCSSSSSTTVCRTVSSVSSLTECAVPPTKLESVSVVKSTDGQPKSDVPPANSKDKLPASLLTQLASAFGAK
jgi:hypothetical protein